MNFFELSSLLAGLTSTIFGLYVFFMTPNRRIARHWGILSATVAVWGFCGVWMCRATSAAEGLWAWRVAYGAGAIWISPLFYHFVCLFVGVERKRLIVTHYVIASLFFLLIPSPLFFHHVRLIFNSIYYLRGGALYPVYFLWWWVPALHAHYEMIRAYRHVSVTKRNQIKYYFLATAIGYSGGLSSYLPNFGIDVYPWGNFSICLYPAIMAYAITRHHLMDINVVIRQTLAYSVVMGVLTVLYLASIALFARLFQGLSGYQTVFSSAVAAGLITVCFQPLRKRVQFFIDTKFFRSYVDQEEKLYELSREVITHTTPDAMAKSLVRVLGETLHPKCAALYLISRDNEGFAKASQEGDASFPDQMRADGPLPAYFRDHPQPFVEDPATGFGHSLETRRPPRKLKAA